MKAERIQKQGFAELLDRIGQSLDLLWWQIFRTLKELRKKDSARDDKQQDAS